MPVVADVGAGTFGATLTPAQDGLVLTWPSDATRFYRIQKSDDLISWSNIGTPLAGNGSPMARSLTSSSGSAFYRVVESVDYYDGQAPALSLISSATGLVLPHIMAGAPVTVEIRLADGNLAPNAPVTVSAIGGDARISSNGLTLIPSPAALKTDSSGRVTFWLQAGNSFNLDTVRISAGTSVPLDVSFRPVGDFSGFYGFFEGDLEEIDTRAAIFGKLHANANCWLGGFSAYADISAGGGFFNSYNPVDPRTRNQSVDPYTVVAPARVDRLVTSWVGVPPFDPGNSNPNDDGPREFIEPPAQGYPDPFQTNRAANLASIVLVVDSSAGTLDVLIGPSPLTSPPISLRAAITSSRRPAASIQDNREGGNVVLTTFDLAILLQKIMAYPSFPGGFNGIVYVKDVAGLTRGSGSLRAIRFVNGSSIPDLTSPGNPIGGLLIASPNGVYLQGDFNCGTNPYSNTAAGGSSPPAASDVLANSGAGNTYFQTFRGGAGYVRKPVAIASDAFTALSNAWQDANSSGALSSRVATSTTMNLLVITGNVPTNDVSFSGGLANTIRLAEDWSGKTFTFYGSLAVPYASVVFTGNWRAQSYGPPLRNWYYDSAFLTASPPGLPVLQLAPQ